MELVALSNYVTLGKVVRAGRITPFSSVQHSMVNSFVYHFDTAVNLDSSAITISLQPDVTRRLGNGSQTTGTFGTIPDDNSITTPDGGYTWVINFGGAGVTTESNRMLPKTILLTALLCVQAMLPLAVVAGPPRLIMQIGHQGGIRAVALSKDGKYLVTASTDKTARLWEVATGRELQVFQGHLGEISSVALSGDGKWLATGSSDGTARLWDTATGCDSRRAYGCGRI